MLYLNFPIQVHATSFLYLETSWFHLFAAFVLVLLDDANMLANLGIKKKKSLFVSGNLVIKLTNLNFEH